MKGLVSRASKLLQVHRWRSSWVTSWCVWPEISSRIILPRSSGTRFLIGGQRFMPKAAFLNPSRRQDQDSKQHLYFWIDTKTAIAPLASSDDVNFDRRDKISKICRTLIAAGSHTTALYSRPRCGIHALRSFCFRVADRKSATAIRSSRCRG